jgi:hypothetical protein
MLKIIVAGLFLLAAVLAAAGWIKERLSKEPSLNTKSLIPDDKK